MIIEATNTIATEGIGPSIHMGHLTGRDGKIYSRASDDETVCSRASVLALVDRGWLKPWRSRYERTRKGKRAVLELEGRA